MTKKEKVLMQKIYSMLQILSEETDKYYLKEAPCRTDSVPGGIHELGGELEKSALIWEHLIII